MDFYLNFNCVKYPYDMGIFTLSENIKYIMTIKFHNSLISKASYIVLLILFSRKMCQDVTPAQVVLLSFRP